MNSEKEQLSSSHQKELLTKETELSKKDALLDRETVEHLETLKKLRDEKQSKRQSVYDDRKKYIEKSANIQNCLGFLMFTPLFIVVVVFAIIYQFDFNKATHFYGNHQFLFWTIAVVLGSSTFSAVISKIRKRIGRVLYRRFCKKRTIKTDGFDESIKLYDDDISKIQKQIEDRMKHI